MTDTKHNGGPAYPIQKTNTHDTWPGMSLRDYFAATADMSGFQFETPEQAAKFLDEETPETVEDSIGFSMRVTARLRYMAADAMLVARAKALEGEQ